MRRKIGVFIGEISGNFQQTITKVITSKANELGYDVAVICSYGSYNDDIMYAEGEKSCIHLPDCSFFDGIIVAEDLFDVPNMGDELYEILKATAKCPVVYLRTKREGFYNISIENTSSIEKMVRHFTDVHGFTDICYMSGKQDIYDSFERLQGFIKVMKEHGLPIQENTIFHGNYWRDKGAEAVDFFMKGREKYPQAIVCANDYMALSICEELRHRGVRIPEDVCVSGFDYVQEARNYSPALTSMEVDFEGMSQRAVEIIDNVNNGMSVPLNQYMSAKLVLNKSCGCEDHGNTENVADLLEQSFQQVETMKNIMLSTMEYQDSFDMDEYMSIAYKYRSVIKSDYAIFCYSDKENEAFDDVENDSLFTDDMIMTHVFDGAKPALKTDVRFSRRQLLPDEFWKKNQPSNYLFFSIHFKNIVYGYMAVKFPEDKWFDIYTQAYLMNLANAIQNGNAHKKMEMLEKIRSLYQRDSLTGLYNRRGYDKLLHDRFSDARENNKNIGIVSIDMDNLKTTNDSFGHSEGDKALKAIATALQSAIKENEFCARVGGDEFAAVIDMTSPDRGSIFKQDFLDALSKLDAQISDYDLGASVGICESSEDEKATLLMCIQKADMRMYEEKRARKEAMKK